MINTSIVKDSRLLFSRIVLSSEPVAVESFAQVPNDTEGSEVHILDWKTFPDENKVWLKYQAGGRAEYGTRRPVYEGTFPLVSNETQLKPPKAKGWEWNSGQWERYTRKGREQRSPGFGDVY